MNMRKLSEAQLNVIHLLKHGGSLITNKTSTLLWLVDKEGKNQVIHAGTFLGLVRRHIIVIDKILNEKRFYRLDYSHKQIVALRESPCPDCDTGEIEAVGYPTPSGLQHFECTDCGYSTVFP